MEMYTLILWVVSGILVIFILYFVIKTAVVNGIRDSGILDKSENSLPDQNPAYYKPNSAQSLLKSRYERGEISFEEYIQEWNKLKS
jgi:uncharacterized membrane protein